MHDPQPRWSTDPRLKRAHGHAQRAEVLQAELLYRAVLRDHASCTPAARALAALAIKRGDLDTAVEHLVAALKFSPGDTSAQLEYAQVLWQRGEHDAARGTIETLLLQSPEHEWPWLLLGEMREAGGDNAGAVRAWFQAFMRAHKAGRWLSHENTDPAIVDAVMRNLDKLKRGRRELLMQSFDEVRQVHGAAALARVERALEGYIGEADVPPADPRQRPKFLYFPDLPAGPYHDPMLQPWAPLLRDAWREIRDEAAALLRDDRDFVSFLGLQPGQHAPQYVAGSNPNASWDAYFFYRRGRRFDDNLARCPATRAVLDAIELCNVANQAPEICFSVIRPQSTIVAHYGVTNTRLVMHLPLIVPQDCALNVIGAGEHHWREGELMMFDDTFQHEAWNRSDEPRLILLMDCWNPHLRLPERQAVTRMIEAIDRIEN